MSTIIKDGYWKVYVHTNKLNCKRYVGITSQKPEYRWNGGKAYKQSPHFWAAIQKYGWDGFTHEILYDKLSEDEAKSKEIELISLWNTQDSRYGYNVSSGGGGNTGFVPSDELRKKWSEIRTGSKRSDETKRKLADASKRNYEKCKAPLAEAKYKPVEMYTLNGEYIRSFGSIKEAYTTIGLKPSAGVHIGDVCMNKRKSCGGYLWKYTH